MDKTVSRVVSSLPHVVWLLQPAPALLAGPFEGLALKWVVAVGVQTPPGGERRRRQVKGDEQRAPTFILPDVYVFVLSSEIEATLVATPNHVA